MAEINHSQLADQLKQGAAASLPSVFLVHGQEMLVEQAAELLVDRLLDGASRDLCCEVVDGTVERTTDVLARMNTFSLLDGPKIVVFREAKLFETRGSHQRLVEQIVEACNDEDLLQAAKSLFSLCGHMEMDPEALLQSAPQSEPLSLLYENLSQEDVRKMVAFGLEQGWRPTGAGDHVETLRQGVERGFADHHYLVITVTAKVPKNLKLYKSLRDHGWIIDCSVPMGERRADRMAQESVLRQTLETSLAVSGKRLQAGLFDTLCRLTGFDLRTFAQNVEKLIDYTGERTEITEDDVHQVLRRTKSDPIFELTSAVADRNLTQSLFFTHALLESNWYPLQILTALANQIRRLLVAKDFTMSDQGKSWSAGMSYQQFQYSVMPAVQAFDNQIRDAAVQWQASAKAEGKPKTGGPKSSADITLAANPNNPYPVFQTLAKSEKYTRQELIDAMLLLNRTDLRLKSTGQDATLVLKKTIMEICGPKTG